MNQPVNESTPAVPATEATPVAANLRPLRALWPFVRRYPKLIAGWLGFLALSSASTLTLPVAVRYMIDRGFSKTLPSHAQTGSIDRWFVLLLAVSLVLAFATAGRFYCVSLLASA